MIPSIYDSRNEAGFNKDRIAVYYGYKVVDPDTDEWCFVVNKNGKEVFRATNSELLGIANGDSPKDMLIAGLTLYMK